MADIVNLDAIDKLLAQVKQEGDQFVLSPEATEAILSFQIALAMMQEADVSLRRKALAELIKWNSKSFRGKGGLLISRINKKSRYAVDPTRKQFLKQVSKEIPNEEEINNFVERNKRLPKGVSLVESEPAVSIRLGKSDE